MSNEPVPSADGPPENAVPEWPAGADEALVRECARHGCEHCQQAVAALEAWARNRDRPDASLDAFAGGETA